MGDTFPTIRDIEDAADRVRDLLAHPGWSDVCRLLEREVDKLDATLDTRPLDTAALYAFQHGRRGGLRGAQEAAHAIVSTADRRLHEQRMKHERGADASQEA